MRISLSMILILSLRLTSRVTSLMIKRSVKKTGELIIQSQLSSNLICCRVLERVAWIWVLAFAFSLPQVNIFNALHIIFKMIQDWRIHQVSDGMDVQVHQLAKHSLLLLCSKVTLTNHSTAFCLNDQSQCSAWRWCTLLVWQCSASWCCLTWTRSMLCCSPHHWLCSHHSCSSSPDSRRPMLRNSCSSLGKL